MTTLSIPTESVSEKKQRLLTLMQSKRQASRVAYPLSYPQQRIWLMEQLTGAGATYNLSFAVRLTGNLNQPALQKSIDEIVARHETLRTCFPERDGVSIQEVLPSMRCEIEHLDFTHLDVARQEEKLLELRTAWASLVFDLQTAPLLRVALVALQPAQHVMLVTMHHIVSDGWSVGVMVQELTQLYRAFSLGEASPLASLPMQYGNFANWQRGWLKSSVYEPQLTYWRQQLANLSVLELPTDRPRPQAASYRGGNEAVTLSLELTRAVNQMSLHEGVTPFMFLLTAFHLLLARYSGQWDIAIGSPIANRTRTELEPLIGCFMNTVVLRTQMHAGESFKQNLKRVRAVTLDAFAHQDMPFEKLVEELDPERSLGRNPLFQVMFNMGNVPEAKFALGDLELTPEPEKVETTKFDLSLFASQYGEELVTSLEFSRDLFDQESAQTMLAHFVQLLKNIVAFPDVAVDRLQLTTPAEVEKLNTWAQASRMEYPRALCFPQMFEAQVARTPSATALEFAEQSLNYAELNAQANRLAHWLKKHGVGPEVLVGLCVARSNQMVVAVLAILKAGGGYIPIDPQYPVDRINYMLSDSEAQVLVTESRVALAFHDYQGTVVSIDEAAEAIAQESIANLQSSLLPQNLAYTIYTSGSTGKPKGVQINHGALANFLHSMAAKPGIQPSDRLLAVTTLSFDIAGLELYLPLIAGACVRILSREAGTDGARLLQAVNDGVTIMQATPSTWLLLLESGWTGNRQLTMLCGGEALAPELAHRLSALGGRLWNMYGPTETTIWSLVEPVAPAADRILIGKSIANTQAYILNPEFDMVPLGVVGELCIAGDGVARGYLNRGDLTAEQFIPDVFGRRGGRLYRTGDLARYKPDGRIECLGRLDHQVKLRGYRIELGEIENALQAHPDVTQAAVLVADKGNNQKVLAAFVVARSPVTAVKLREFVRRQLPEFMVPAQIVQLEQLPLTPNGKIDRRALPLSRLETSSAEAALVAPSTPVEEILCGIWAHVLQLKQVGVSENFFDLGGHSLLAMRVKSRINSVFSMDLPLRAVFEHPTIAALAGYIDRELGVASKAANPLLPGSRTEERVLSYAQQRLWFIEQLNPQSSLYNMPFAFRIEGPLDQDALARSLNEVMRRHDVLRATFFVRDGSAVQRIDNSLRVPIEFADFADASEEVLRAEQRREAEKPFDLQVGPPLRVKLLRLAEQKHLLLLTMHHIVSDGWSMDILMREVAQLYEAYRKGLTSPLTELKIQYSDFAAWQRDWLRDEVLQQQLDYWRSQLAELPAFEMPTDHRRPANPTFAGASQHIILGPEEMESIRLFCRKNGATLFMTLLAAFQLLLARYTGQWDIAVGTLVANRSHEEAEALIGFFMNTLVLRSKIDPDGNFSSLLRQVRETTIDGYAQQDLPFDRLVEELDPERALGRNPFFQALFTLQNTPTTALRVDDVLVFAESTEVKTSKFDLGLFATERGQSMDVGLEYSAELFDPDTIRRLLGHWRALLLHAVADPARPVGQLTLLPKTEQQAIVDEWNATFVPYPEGLCAQQLFELQTGKTPQAIAVAHDDESWTYFELNRKANQLAHHLQTCGVGPEVLVGFCLERSLNLPLAVLGILKAGGAYLPLDPEHPADRLAYLAKDSGVKTLLTQKSLLPLLEGFPGRIILLDTQWAEMELQSDANPVATGSPDNLAYIIYTSGSTGRPKGVLMQHRGLVNIAVAQRQLFSPQPHDAILQFASCGFDASVWEMWMAWAHGARLQMTERDVVLDPAKLSGLIRRHRITTATLPPSLVLAMKPEQLNGLTRLIVGGEASTSSILQFAGSSRQLFNVYGPTEITCVATAALCAPGDAAPPIGKPIANTRAYVLDQAMQPVPLGVAGELYITGPGLCRGYLNQPVLTAERLVPDPFAANPGGRLYRTGDRVCLRADGQLEFLDRLDQQVKIRGHRIELGEIESALHRLVQVEQAIVLVREDKPGDRKLVAYIVPAAIDAPPSAHDLRAALKANLPDYMVPGAFVVVPSIPLTVNGKIDREALPQPVIASTSTYVAPHSEQEVRLAAIWAEVLGVERVGVHDNLFELGGHSLLAMQLIARIRAEFAVELPLRTLFVSPTIAGVVHELTSLRTEDMKRSPALVRSATPEASPLSYAQFRLWFLDQLQPGSPAYNMPIGLRFAGVIDRDALQWSLNELVRRHEVLRTVFPTLDGAPRRRVNDAMAPHIAFIDLQPSPPAERVAKALQLAKQEAEIPFYLAEGPLLRVTLLRLAERDHVLLLTLHHIIADGWSVGIMVREFSQLYADYFAGRQASLPELDLQYADFAAWQQEWLEGGVLDEQLSYWRSKLEGLAPLDLPTDHARPPVLSNRGEGAAVRLPAGLVTSLRDLAIREGATLFMVALGAWQILLGKYSGQPDIAVGTAVANRTRKETEALIGCFANTLVLREQIDPDITFRELLQRGRQTALEAYEHQDVPFEKLVADLQPDRDLSRSALFQVMFTLQNPIGELDIPGVTITDFSPANHWSKFDLSLELAESPSGIHGQLLYSLDLFTADYADQLVRHWITILQQVSVDPGRRIADIELMRDDEKTAMLHGWNDTRQTVPETYLTELFAAQVMRTPGSVAVLSGESFLTYTQLNERANQLAHHLLSLGIGREARVGICVTRTVEMVIGVLGILKAGAAYVPLDARHPADRLRFMMEDSAMSLLLTMESLDDRVPSFPGCVVRLDADWDRIRLQPSHNPGILPDPQNLAYVIYTSGSTGTPKGVQISHAGLANFFYAMRQQFPLGPQDRVLAVTTLCFDIAGMDIYLPLISGAQLAIADYDVSTSGQGLVESLDGITVLQATPASWQMMLESGWTGTPGLTILCGGEALTHPLASRLAEKGSSLWNMYGPTETTIYSLTAKIHEDSEYVPIGTPVLNTNAYVLDSQMNPVPLGARGELFLGGAGLARGYWRRPGLTAEKFIPDPFSEVPGARLYRTGDVVRWRRDKQIEYLGRTDHQVKIRGFRIELGEIETALQMHPAVAQAVVTVTEGSAGRKQLVGYVVLKRSSEEVAPSVLRNSLRASLPDYMIPASLIVLQAFPLNPNGKIDRKRLPSPDSQEASAASEFVPPRNEVESILCDIWKDVLERDGVGVFDNFFEVGGDSLSSVQVIARAGQQGLRLTAQQIFQHQTVAALAEQLFATGAAFEPSPRPDANNVTTPLASSFQLNEEELAEVATQLGL